ncbi:MAG: diguanylate cyclase [Clostridiales bacterium]|jgi:diguanylate cyclase (GGDEF)-like protein|nr:diguanylate cyclase [Clostridiales bacterium]
MNDFFYEVLDKLNIGIVLLDEQLNVRYWNAWMINKTDITISKALGASIGELSHRLGEPKYKGLLQGVLSSGNSRFLSGAIHGDFFKVRGHNYTDKCLQNVQLERVVHDNESMLLVQVFDMTDQYGRVQHMKEFIKRLTQENDEIRQDEERARRLAYNDQLTGLPNRLFFENNVRSRLEEMLSKGVSTEHFAIGFIDLDNLKGINDQYGHRTGDFLLKEMALRLKRSLKKGDLVARLSGDEFAVLIENRDGTEDIKVTLEKLVNYFDEKVIVDKFVLDLTYSIGISCFPDNGSDLETLLDKADKALYHVKKNGKAGYAFYDENYS